MVLAPYRPGSRRVVGFALRAQPGSSKGHCANPVGLPKIFLSQTCWILFLCTRTWRMPDLNSLLPTIVRQVLSSAEAEGVSFTIRLPKGGYLEQMPRTLLELYLLDRNRFWAELQNVDAPALQLWWKHFERANEMGLVQCLATTTRNKQCTCWTDLVWDAEAYDPAVHDYCTQHRPRGHKRPARSSLRDVVLRRYRP
jgi:hypothetical protein